MNYTAMNNLLNSDFLVDHIDINTLAAAVCAEAEVVPFKYLIVRKTYAKIILSVMAMSE